LIWALLLYMYKLGKNMLMWYSLLQEKDVVLDKVWVKH